MKSMPEKFVCQPELNHARVGERVTALRQALAKTKAQFADELGLDRSTLSKVEQGNKGLDIAVGVRIADLYGVGLDYTYRGTITDAPETLRVQILAEINAARMAKATIERA